MWEKPPPSPQPTSQTFKPHRLSWLIGLCLLLWVLQLAWLAWQLREEVRDVPRRIWSHSWGEAVRREDPFYRWLVQLDRIIPPHSSYLFLDNYEAGKEIEARFHLFPRHHNLIRPQAPPSKLFHVLRNQQVAYLLVRDAKQPLGSGLTAAIAINIAEPLPLSGPGLVFRVNPARITGGFYD